MSTVTRPRVLTGSHFMSGNFASAEGALAAGCGFFAGYPITPSTEIAERLAARLPELGGAYIQMEDELASIAAVVGAAWGGARAMTATSGPGFTLMMEGIGLAVMMEAPCVVVDVQRGSPSTGLPTLVGQSDVMLARWGSHGDYEIVAYSPASCQEMFDLTVKAFDVADALRIPVFILADQIVAHMTERVVIPPGEDIHIRPRRQLDRRAASPLPLLSDGELVPPMPKTGAGHRFHVTGLTHDERGYPSTDPDVHERLVRRLGEKVRRHAPELLEWEELHTEDAEVVVVAYGSVARSARQAVREARSKGIRCGLFRPVTLWPFPKHRVRELDAQVRSFIVTELNLGQVAGEVERYASREVRQVNHPGGAPLSPAVILAAIEEAAR
jgi:2-oxoglutarate/2-oxoacid ferredoxin oxidoreductase subunit alpha